MNRTWIVVVLACLLSIVDRGSALADELFQLEGVFVDLTTDVESREEAETLVASLDSAVPQWISFWNLPADAATDWKIKAFVMRDKTRFLSQGLIPDRVPDFPFGYALGDSVWVLAQPSQYYTRHLLLHEGAHSFAFHCFGGAGPTWFMEGTAELLATHTGAGTAIKINQIPTSRDQVPYWGRFKKMAQVRAASSLPIIETVMTYPPTLSGDVESYGWSWAAASMFSAYPDDRETFNLAAKNGQDAGPEFNRQIHSRLSAQWPVVAAQWRLLTSDFDFGFDWDRERVELSTDDPMWDGQALKMSVRADRGWQSAGVLIPANANLEIKASGEVTLASDPKPWISRPAGITIQYNDGRPLGQLLARLLPTRTPRQGRFAPVAVETVGDGVTIAVPQHCWLLFRVNDEISDMANNDGAFDVTVEKK